MTKPILIPESVQGRGYVGLWDNNTLGWGMPNHVDVVSETYSGDYDLMKPWRCGQFYLCEITIKPVLDSKGRPVTKFIRKPTE